MRRVPKTETLRGIREIEVITQGWTKADGTFIPPLKTKYNYKFNDITYTYEKVK